MITTLSSGLYGPALKEKPTTSAPLVHGSATEPLLVSPTKQAVSKPTVHSNAGCAMLFCCQVQT